MMIQKLSKTSNALYEVHAMHPEGRTNTGAFSCENDCPRCVTKCEFGVNMINTTRGHSLIVGV